MRLLKLTFNAFETHFHFLKANTIAVTIVLFVRNFQVLFRSKILLFCLFW